MHSGIYTVNWINFFPPINNSVQQSGVPLPGWWRMLCAGGVFREACFSASLRILMWALYLFLQIVLFYCSLQRFQGCIWLLEAMWRLDNSAGLSKLLFLGGGALLWLKTRKVIETKRGKTYKLELLVAVWSKRCATCYVCLNGGITFCLVFCITICVELHTEISHKYWKSNSKNELIVLWGTLGNKLPLKYWNVCYSSYIMGCVGFVSIVFVLKMISTTG